MQQSESSYSVNDYLIFSLFSESILMVVLLIDC